jgi:hypothetical protein
VTAGLYIGPDLKAAAVDNRRPDTHQRFSPAYDQQWDTSGWTMVHAHR